MKIVTAADLHIGRRHEGTYQHVDRVATTCQVIYDMVRVCQVYDSHLMVLAGDVLDKAQGEPDLPVLLALHLALEYAHFHGIQVHWMRGNHEIYIYSQLARNVMRLFRQVCHVVEDVSVLGGSGEQGFAVMVPWHPDANKMKADYVSAALLARQQRSTCVLFSHVGLGDARPSPSNFQLPQAIESRDLLSDSWNAVWLGDYHCHQQVGGPDSNVYYMGAPIPHTFGDSQWGGVWIMDLERDEYTAVDLVHGPAPGFFDGLKPAGPQRYPLFQKWSSEDSALPPEFPINPQDYNEITVAQRWVEEMENRYPSARVLPWQRQDATSDTQIIDGIRLRKDDNLSSEELVDNWMKYRKTEDIDIRKTGISLLDG